MMTPRIEHKLRLDRTDYGAFLRWLQIEGAEVEYPDRRVNSTYFDSSTFQMFQDTYEGLVPRKKVRIRCYGTHKSSCASPHQLETKLTTDEGRLKEVRSAPEWRTLHASGVFDSRYGICKPVVAVSYVRSYYRLHEVRVTVDRHLQYQLISPLGISGHFVRDANMAFEIKAQATDDLDRLANAFPFARTHFSKYERALLATKRHKFA